MKLYLATLIAYKGSMLSCTSDIILTNDEHKAHHDALNVCCQRFPASDGYSNHQCHLAIIPEIIGGYRIVLEPVNVVDAECGCEG